MKITGHLQYLQNQDMRELKSALIHEPTTDPLSGISLFSLYGSNTLEWVKRGAILGIVILFIFLTFTTSLKILVKKLM